MKKDYINGKKLLDNMSSMGIKEEDTLPILQLMQYVADNIRDTVSLSRVTDFYKSIK